MVQLLRRDLDELVIAAWDMFDEVEPWDEGYGAHMTLYVVYAGPVSSVRTTRTKRTTGPKGFPRG